MNAAGRLVHHGILSRHVVVTHILSRRQIAIFIFFLTIVMSALSIIYVTHNTRLLHATYQHLLLDQAQYNAKYSQLLLERSAWMMQSRVQDVAQNKLKMVVPDYKTIVIIKE